MKPIKYLEIILKTVERCNINCSYCYFFNGIDQSFLKHPKYIEIDTIKQVAHFLKDSCIKLKVETLQIDFHGGEPLMQRKDQFDKMCEIFSKQLSDIVNLTFAVQTNAILVSDAWIELFNKYNVKVGISIDGPKEYNDKYRIDHKGNGTYDKVVAGINKLRTGVNSGKIDEFGALCVINPEYSGSTIYRHLVDDLNFRKLDFLLPDFTHDSFHEHTRKTGMRPSNYGKYLCDIFHEWTNDNNPQIYVRILKSAISILMGRTTSLMNFGPTPDDVLAFTIASNGDIVPDDTLRSTNADLFHNGLNVYNSSIDDFKNQKIFNLIDESNLNLPTKCKECCWEKVCLGGAHVNRYSNENYFNNPSVYCEGLKSFYTNISVFLLNHGVAYEDLKNNLCIA